MPTTENTAAARRWFDAMSRHDLDVVQELFAPGYALHYPGLPEGMGGHDAIRALVGGYYAAFPDLRFTVERTVAEGDLVLVHWTAEGTHRGELLGIAPTGRRAAWTGTSLLRMRDARVVEDWVHPDAIGLFAQLGVPVPGAPVPA